MLQTEDPTCLFFTTESVDLKIGVLEMNLNIFIVRSNKKIVW